MKRKALGKGLRSLIPQPPARPAVASEETPARPSTGLLQIDIDRIRPNRAQPRRQFDAEPLEELARSMREQGVLQPVIVRPAGDGFELVAGERRWRAAQQAGLLKVPALVRDVADDRMLEVALIENLQREELNPIEAATAFQALIEELGLTQEEVARRVGKQRATVANMLRVLELPRSVQEKLRSGQISLGHAKALASIERTGEQIEVAERIVRHGLSVRQVEAIAARARQAAAAGSTARGASAADPNVTAAEDRLQRTLQTKVKIVQGARGGGRIELHFHGHEELERVYRLLLRAGAARKPADKTVGAEA